MKKILVLAKGEFESQGSGRFAKEIAHVGKFVHPRTGQEIVFTPERLEKLALSNERYIKNGNKIPFPDGHSFKSVDNLGHWPGPFIRYQDKLVGVVEATDPKALQKLSTKTMTAVSAMIEFNVEDPKGEKYDEVCTHICATEYPVVTGQSGFLELSRQLEEKGEHPLYLAATEIPAEVLAAGGDIFKQHDQLHDDVKAHVANYHASKAKNGDHHPDTKAAASKALDAADRLHRQAGAIRSHVANTTGGPMYMSREAVPGDLAQELARAAAGCSSDALVRELRAAADRSRTK